MVTAETATNWSQIYRHITQCNILHLRRSVASAPRSLGDKQKRGTESSPVATLLRISAKAHLTLFLLILKGFCGILQ